MAVARSSSDDNTIRYVLPVLWMTSCLPIIVQANATRIGRVLRVPHQEVGQHRGEVWCVMSTIALSGLSLSCHSRLPDHAISAGMQRVLCTYYAIFPETRGHSLRAIWPEERCEFPSIGLSPGRPRGFPPHFRYSGWPLP